VYSCLFLCNAANINLDGEAGLCPFTALVTVNPITERANHRRGRSQGQVMIRPLAEHCHHVSEEWVALHIRVCCTQNSVGHFSDLRTGCGQ